MATKRGVSVRALQRVPFFIGLTMPELRQIGRLFEKQTGKPVTLIVSSSGLLAQQIEQGAPVDVFASASKKYVDKLAKEGHVNPKTVRPFAIGRLAVCRMLTPSGIESR